MKDTLVWRNNMKQVYNNITNASTIRYIYKCSITTWNKFRILFYNISRFKYMDNSIVIIWNKISFQIQYAFNGFSPKYYPLLCSISILTNLYGKSGKIILIAAYLFFVAFVDLYYDLSYLYLCSNSWHNYNYINLQLW